MPMSHPGHRWGLERAGPAGGHSHRLWHPLIRQGVWCSECGGV